MFIYFILYWKVSLLILLKSIYKCRFWLQQRKRKRCWFQTVAAAVRVSRNACRGCELVMIDRLDWWTCRTRYYMCYRERYRLTIDQKREYACGTVWRRVLAATPIYEPVKLYDGGFRYLMNERMPVPFECHTSGALWLPVAELALWICKRLLMWNLSYEHNFPGKFCYSRKLSLLNKFPRKDRAIMKRMIFWISKFHYYTTAKNTLKLIQAKLSTIMKYLRWQKGKIKIFKKES